MLRAVTATPSDSWVSLAAATHQSHRGHGNGDVECGKISVIHLHALQLMIALRILNQPTRASDCGRAFVNLLGGLIQFRRLPGSEPEWRPGPGRRGPAGGAAARGMHVLGHAGPGSHGDVTQAKWRPSTPPAGPPPGLRLSG